MAIDLFGYKSTPIARHPIHLSLYPTFSTGMLLKLLAFIELCLTLGGIDIAHIGIISACLLPLLLVVAVLQSHLCYARQVLSIILFPMLLLMNKLHFSQA